MVIIVVVVIAVVSAAVVIVPLFPLINCAKVKSNTTIIITFLIYFQINMRFASISQKDLSLNIRLAGYFIARVCILST